MTDPTMPDFRRWIVMDAAKIELPGPPPQVLDELRQKGIRLPLPGGVGVHLAMSFPLGFNPDITGGHVIVVPESILAEVVKVMRIAAEASQDPKVEKFAVTVIAKVMKLTGKDF